MEYEIGSLDLMVSITQSQAKSVFHEAIAVVLNERIRAIDLFVPMDNSLTLTLLAELPNETQQHKFKLPIVRCIVYLFVGA